MNKARKAFITLAVILSVIFSLGGCASERNKTVETKVINHGIISYVATETSVYSSTAEVVKAVADSVVEISTESVTTQWGRQYIVSGAGSGVIIGADNETYFIVTNNHVIEGANEITVRTRAGKSFEGTLIATDDSADIAVISVTTSDELVLAVWGDSDSLQIGEDLIAIGNPLGSLGGTVTKGILSATGRVILLDNYARTLLQTDTAINPGNSGGGLFNMRGQLIGIVNAKKTDEEIEGICFAIPGNTAARVCDDLMRYGYIKGRATFNLELKEGTISSSSLGGQSKTVVYVDAVKENTPSGFKKYDMIYKINGMEITSLLYYNVALSRITAGDTVQVEVYRGSISQGIWNTGITFSNEVTSLTVTALQYGA